MIFLVVVLPHHPRRVRDVGVVRGLIAACLRHPKVNSKEGARFRLKRVAEIVGLLFIYSPCLPQSWSRRSMLPTMPAFSATYVACMASVR